MANPATLLLIATVAGLGVNVAAQAGAFGSPEFPDPFAPGDLQDVADLELADAQRRAGIRRSILAGQETQDSFLPTLGTPTILGAAGAQSPPTQQVSVLGE